MRDKAVIITGASEGIGRVLAHAFAREGARLVLAARNAAALEEVVRECEGFGAKAVSSPTDVADIEACRRLIERSVEAFGGIDVLVKNAGISMTALFESVEDLGLFERLMRVNYLGAVYCTHFALPHLKGRKGLLVAVSSLQGKTGFPRSTGYSATKFAMQGFFDSLRIELEGSGVGVLVVSPGAVDTSIHLRKLAADGSMAAVGGRIQRNALMPVDVCARQILRAVKRRDRELPMTFQGRLMPWVRLIAPALLDRTVARAVERFYRGGER